MQEAGLIGPRTTIVTCRVDLVGPASDKVAAIPALAARAPEGYDASAWSSSPLHVVKPS